MRGLVALALLAAAPAVSASPKIVIDAGHGGMDPGGSGNGMQEKNVVLDVAKRFKALLDADTADTHGGSSWTPLMTRTTDVFVPLASRAAYSNSNGADRFMCIHANAFSDPSAHGTETFSYLTTGTGANLRDVVQQEVVAAWHTTNRGDKTANFEVLRDTACPAELHELSFITNTSDAALLASPIQRQKAAEAHLRAIQRHYGITPYVPPPPPTSDTGDIEGMVVDNIGAIGGATVHLDTGDDTVTGDDGTFKFPSAPKGMHQVTASAQGYQDSTVAVTVAVGVANNVTIELTLTPPPPPPPDPPGSQHAAGCSAAGGSGGALALVLGLLLVRRRRRA